MQDRFPRWNVEYSLYIDNGKISILPCKPTDIEVTKISIPGNKKDFSTYFDSGDFLFREGEPGEYAYIIESGSVEVFHQQRDSKLVLANLQEGDLVGEIALIGKEPHPSSARALQPTRAIAISSDYIDAKISEADPTIRMFLRYIVVRYRDMHSRFTRVFDGIENFGDKPVNATNEDTTAEINNVIRQYQEMQRHLSSVVNMPSRPTADKPVGDMTLLHTKLVVTQDKSIKSALKDEEFFLKYQPVIDLTSKKIVGCEALVRWHTADGKVLPPSEFIPRTEMSGMIVDLGYWIVRTACAFQKRLSRKFEQPLFVSINLSGKQFDDPDLIDSLANIMSETGIVHSLIKFEITESLLMENPDIARDALYRLKKTGAKLAIDDFGTGYSSFSYLHQLPFDTLKIDRSFISTLSSNAKSKEIVKSLVNMSHDLGMDVIAEGIETKFDLKMLRHLGTDFGQGFLFSKGLIAEKLIKLIARQSARSQHS